MKFLFRADGGHPIGTGHLFRVSRIAEKLISKGHECHIVTGRNETSEKIFTTSRCVPLWITPIDYSGKAKPEFRADKVLAILAKGQYDAFVVDMLDTTQGEMMAISALGVPIATFDDRGEGRKFASAIINVLVRERESTTISSSSNLYEGGKYVTLSDDFIRPECIKPEPNAVVTSALVVMGGADAAGLSVKCVSALGLVDSIQRVEIMAGPAFTHLPNLKFVLDQVHYDSEILTFMPSLLPAYHRNDICLVAGGLAMYEVCRVGIPSIAIPQSIDHQFELAQILADEGAMLTVGWGEEASENDIAECISKLVGDHDLRTQMAINGLRIVDGQGVERVANILVDVANRN